jgi:hypothetical protein
MRLSKETKNELVIKILEGVSIKKISKQMNLNTATIYYYYEKIKGRKYKKLELKPGFTKEEGEIVGIFAGDGSQWFGKKDYSYEVRVHFGYKNKDYALYVKELYEKYFGKIFELWNDGTKTWRLRTTSKDIYYFFHIYMDFVPQIKHCTVKLRTLYYPEKFKIGFLKGLIDTDGHIGLHKHNQKVVNFCTTSKELAIQITQILRELNILYSHYVQTRRNHKPVHYVKLYQRSVAKFINQIRPFKMKRLGW